MRGFTRFMAARLPGVTVLPPLLADLFDWIDGKGWVGAMAGGAPFASLGPGDGWLCDGTSVTFHVGRPEERAADSLAWLGVPGLQDRLVPFARTGIDGSYAGFWLGPDGVQRIVHLGSGSGSVLTCVLADEPADFLRLLGIGYPEICWLDHDNLGELPSRDDGYSVLNAPYRSWLAEHGLTVPPTAADVITTPALMTDEDSPDLFWKWLALTCGW